MNNVIQVENISFSFREDQKLIKNLSFKGQNSQVIALIGKSGSGKSTILNLLSGLLIPDQGKIMVDDKAIKAPTLKISYQRQNSHLLDYRTAIENALLGLELREDLTKNKIKRVEEYFQSFNLSEAKNKYPGELSGGMRQRVSLIQSLAVKASVYLFDEPFSAIDSVIIKTIQDIIWNKIRSENSSLILVTHSLEQALEIGDSVVILSSKIGNIERQIKFDDEFVKLSPSIRKKSLKYNEYLFDLVKVFADS